MPHCLAFKAFKSTNNCILLSDSQQNPQATMHAAAVSRPAVRLFRSTGAPVGVPQRALIGLTLPCAGHHCLSKSAQRNAAHAVSCDATVAAAGAAQPAGSWRGFAVAMAATRAVLFYTTTFLFASPLFVVMLAAYPYVLLFDKFR
jgi:hypothetical protein